MRQSLKLHPDSQCAAATRVDVDIARPHPGQLLLRYGVTGMLDDLRIAPAAAAARTDELWRHTCFEAFVRAPTGAAYYEFNFAPSTEWAAYHFTHYREAMRVAEEISTPVLSAQRRGARLELDVRINIPRSPDLPQNGAWRVGLSAVLEETNGRVSYWALHHPPGKADFHHGDCFAFELPAASDP